LGFGGFHLLEIPASEAEYLLDAYLDAGGNYIETAASYGNGESERKVGRVMARRRDECILATKTSQRDRSGCIESLEQSLRRLQTDHVDLLLMHGVASEQELERILGPDGALEGVLQLRRQGKVKHVGISMHGQPNVLISALRRYPFDAVMSTINYFDRCNFPEIEQMLLPLAAEKGAGVILMKPLADGLLWRSVPQAFRYAMSRPVSVVVAGMNTREMLQKDLRLAEEFTPMTAGEEAELLRTAPELGDYVCRQCGACNVCPEGIDIPKVFLYEGYFDRQLRDGQVRDAAEFALRDRLRFWFDNRQLAKDGYAAMHVQADKCTGCGACRGTCSYGIDILRKLAIADYKLAARELF
jgi:hypothetical protein